MDIKASDIMSDHVVVIRTDMLLSQAAHLMLRDRVSSFPVVNEAGAIVGIITMTDLFVLIDQVYPKFSPENFERVIIQMKDRKVAEIMSHDVLTVTPETNLLEIIHWVIERGIHCFPVLEGKDIVGIVSRHDILNAIFTCISK